MSCGIGGKYRYFYSGNQVGWLNYVGDLNFVAGGPEGSGLSAGTTVGVFFPNSLNRRPWLNANAVFDDNLLDASYPVMNIQWIADIELDTDVTFRISNRSFYVQDKDGNNRYYDARAEKPPVINVTVGEWLSPNYEVSDVVLSLNNRDGYFNDFLPYGANFRQWSGAKITIKVGFGEKYENYFTLFEGQVTVKQGIETTRDTVELRAYDKLDLDEVPIPPLSFSADIYPDIGEEASGKAVPLVYGDWSTDVPTWGSVEAICTNAGDDEAVEFEFKVSDLAMESIESVWLHRGNRKEDEPEGPIEFDMDAITLDLPAGKFLVPVGEDVFATEAVLLDSQAAGAGSGTNLITAKDATINFLSQKIQLGDRILKRKTGEYATVSAITNTQLTLSGGVDFAQDDEYVVFTKKYKFINGDKVSVVCKGKKLNLIDITRIQDVSTTILQPQSITIDFDGTYWLADDATQKVYHLSFDNEILKEIAYSAIDASVTSISSISVGTDKKLWLVDPVTSTIYRYNHEEDGLGLSFTTGSVTGISASLANVTGIEIKADGNIWIVDQATGDFYEIDWSSAVNPFVVTTFNKSAFDNLATEILDISYDEQNNQVVAVDRDTNKFYRINETTGALISSFSLATVADNVAFVTGVDVAQDGTIFFVDQGTLQIYNYNDLAYASQNPAFIARDLLQSFGGHNYDEFDLSWNQTARQLADYKCRAVIADKTNVITYINNLLKQYNVVFHLRFTKYALFWITFENFRADGKLVKEKDIKVDSFRPKKEMNQYFNSATATYDKRPFQASTRTSDTYVSTSGIAFAAREVNKKLDLPNVYRREDLDKLMPLYVRLAVPEPEFVDVTFGFRVLRSQMQDFLTVHFDGDVNLVTGRKESGRRFDMIPCMVRKISYDLGPMTVGMKLWSLGSTEFPGYTPPGRTVGGVNDKIVLTNLGRLGRVSPVGTITGSSSNTITLEDVDGQDAESRTAAIVGLAWKPGYKVSIIDGETKEVLETLQIESVSGGTITFTTSISTSVANTIKNNADFISGGHYLQYSNYGDMTNEQRSFFASFSRPTSGYPLSRTREIEEQRGGLHSFDDGGIPYVLYPEDFVSY